MGTGNEPTPEKFRNIADWFDSWGPEVASLLERMSEAADLDPQGPLTRLAGLIRGTAMQDDLRQWAEDLESGRFSWCRNSYYPKGEQEQ